MAEVAVRGLHPGAALQVLPSSVALLHPQEAVFEAMLAGWAAQQVSRLLARGTIETGQARIATLEQAARMLAGTPSTWYEARAQLALGDAHSAAGDQVQARAGYRAAAGLAVRGGYRDLATKARVRGSAAAGRPVPRTGRLTPSEARVAGLAAAGATNREIAATLVVALRTVEIHLTSVYRKLGISGRAELASGLAAVS